MIRSVLTIKGGSGKTTTAINLAGGFAKAGRKTLLIDLDGQANCTTILMGNKWDDSYKTITNVLAGEVTLEDAISPTVHDNLFLVGADIELFYLEKQMTYDTSSIQQFRLRQALKSVLPLFDEIVIDNGPALNLMATNSVCASNEVIIPCDMGKASFKGMEMARNYCKDLIDGMDLNLSIRVLFTKVNRNKGNALSIEHFRALLDDTALKTQIRYQAKAVFDSDMKSDLLINDQKSNVAADYRALVAELLGDNHG